MTSNQLTPALLRRSFTAISFSCLCLLLTYCGVVNVFPVSEDIALGKQFDQEIRQDPKTYPIRNDAATKSYVQNIVNKIITAPDIKYRGKFTYSVEIIQDDKTINAFCTPGGYIYVYTGLLKLIDNEATLAGVLGHEIAHAEQRHSTDRMTTQLGLEAVTAIALGKSGNQDIALLANAFTGLGLLKNSRNDEDEADEYSFKYLRSTQWYPGGILYFFEKVRGRGGSAIDELLSTHPLPDSRIKETQSRLKSANIPPPTEAQLNSRGYQDIKRKL